VREKRIGEREKRENGMGGGGVAFSKKNAVTECFLQMYKLIYK